MSLKKKVKKETAVNDGFWGNIKALLYAALIVLIVRSFIIQPVKIPSGSMRPTLLVGDYLFISKMAYGYSKFSIPVTFDFFSGRLWGSEPKRGDIAVFRLPSDNSVDYIKRVIGLPGETVQLINGLIYINGKAIERQKLPDLNDKDVTDINGPVELYKETLPNGVSYNSIYIFPESIANNTKVYRIPEGHYFMLGDNRDNSLDSRFEVGFVPYENFIGKANIIFLSLNDVARIWEIWKWPLAIRYNRLFTWVSNLTYGDVETNLKDER
ncbi:signal peptidase I [Bartonella sp. DGB1]|uniref:signal peptidase I n=1 Tax=Bartonella sp. DGB1 TaxID=3239807 RepID=UPI0035254F40